MRSAPPVDSAAPPELATSLQRSLGARPTSSPKPSGRGPGVARSPVGDPQRVPHFHDQRRQPFGITTGPDGSLWFTEVSGNKVGQINPATHVTTEFSLPTASSAPSGITSGPDGNLWFTEESGNNIGQVVLAAPPTAADLSLSGTAPRSAVMGQDVTYILTVTNNGTAEATNVTL